MNKHFEPLIARWRGEKIECGKGVTEQAILDFEWKEKIKLSGDVRSYFFATNGMGSSEEYDEMFNNFRPLEELVPLNDLCPECSEVVSDSNAYYVFADFSMGLCYYAVRLQEASNSPDDVIDVLASSTEKRGFRPPIHHPAQLGQRWPRFMDFMNAYIEDPMSIV